MRLPRCTTGILLSRPSKWSIRPTRSHSGRRWPISLSGNQEGTGNQNRVTVCANGSACADVNLQGTVVGIDPERVPLIPAGGSYQAKVWVNGNQDTSHTCAFSPAVAGASVTDDGLITAPGRDHADRSGHDDAGLHARRLRLLAKSYAAVEFMPWSPDGSLRLCFGCLKQTVTDSHGQKWFGQLTQRAVTNSYQPGAGLDLRAAVRLVEFLSARTGAATPTRTCTAPASRSITMWRLHVALPNGSLHHQPEGRIRAGRERCRAERL